MTKLFLAFIALLAIANASKICNYRGYYYQERCICSPGWKGDNCETSAIRFLQALRILNPECNYHGYLYKKQCFCQPQWKGPKCEKPNISGWSDSDDYCDDLINRLDYLTNISPENYGIDDEEFPRLKGNSIGDMSTAYGEKGHKWIKMHDITSNFHLFSNKIDPTDIHQGEVPNCYLWAALAAMSVFRNGEMVRDLFVTQTDNNKHVYVTRWLINGKPRFVAVDDWVPGEGKTPRFAALTKDQDAWPLILEKAWGKIHGNYMITNFGWHGNVWKSLIQAPVFDLFHNKTITPDSIYNFIKKLYDQEFPVGAATVNIDKTNEEQQHAYAILGYHEIELDNKAKQRLIRMYNPYNRDYWKTNPWADNGPKWTAKVKSQIKEYVNESDGQFFVTPEDYLGNFGVTTWSEPRKNYDVEFMDIGIKQDMQTYTVAFSVSQIQSNPLYLFIDKWAERIRYFCDEPFTVSEFKLKTPKNEILTADAENMIVVKNAVDGKYEATFKFKRNKSFLKYFTINTYGPSGKITFIQNSEYSIPDNSKKCPGDCKNNGRCNYEKGVCKCDTGFKGADCGEKDAINCLSKNCSGNGTCDTTQGKCNCNKGFTGDDCRVKV